MSCAFETPFPHIPMAPGSASVTGLTQTSLPQPPRGPPGPPGDPGNEVRDWPCCGTRVVEQTHWGCSETGGAQFLGTPLLPHGAVDEDPHHAPTQSASSASPIHGASIAATIFPALLSTGCHSVPGDDELTLFLSCTAGRKRQARSSWPEGRGWRASK